MPQGQVSIYKQLLPRETNRDSPRTLSESEWRMVGELSPYPTKMAALRLTAKYETWLRP